MKSWKKKVDFKILIKKEKKISNILKSAEIDKIFDIKYHLKNIDSIFNREINEK